MKILYLCIQSSTEWLRQLYWLHKIFVFSLSQPKTFIRLHEKLFKWVHLVLGHNKCGSCCIISLFLNTRSWCQWEKLPFLQLALFHQSCLKLSKNVVQTTCRFVWPLKGLNFPTGSVSLLWELICFLSEFRQSWTWFFIIYHLYFFLLHWMIQEYSPRSTAHSVKLDLEW